MAKDPQDPIQQVAREHASQVGRKARSLKLNIMASYLLTPASLEEVGRAYGGVSRQRGLQITQESIQALWEKSSPELKKRFSTPPAASKEKDRLYLKSIVSAAMTGDFKEIKKLSQSSQSKWRKKLREKFDIELPMF